MNINMFWETQSRRKNLYSYICSGDPVFHTFRVGTDFITIYTGDCWIATIRNWIANCENEKVTKSGQTPKSSTVNIKETTTLAVSDMIPSLLETANNDCR